MAISRLQKLSFVAGLGGGLLLASVALLALGEPPRPDTIEERHPTWKKARAAKLDERGLLPSFVPESAKEIVVRAHPREGHFRGSFRFPIKAGRAMKPKLADVPAAETEGAHPLPEPYDRWWPTWLQGPLTAGPPGNPGYSLHRPLGADNEVGELLVACNLTKGHCLYWSDRR